MIQPDKGTRRAAAARRGRGGGRPSLRPRLSGPRPSYQKCRVHRPEWSAKENAAAEERKKGRKEVAKRREPGQARTYPTHLLPLPLPVSTGWLLLLDPDHPDHSPQPPPRRWRRWHETLVGPAGVSGSRGDLSRRRREPGFSPPGRVFATPRLPHRRGRRVIPPARTRRGVGACTRRSSLGGLGWGEGGRGESTEWTATRTGRPRPWVVFFFFPARVAVWAISGVGTERRLRFAGWVVVFCVSTPFSFPRPPPSPPCTARASASARPLCILLLRLAGGSEARRAGWRGRVHLAGGRREGAGWWGGGGASRARARG